MIEALIFDLDGTLVNLPINYDSLLNEIKLIMHVEKVRPVAEVVSKADESTKKRIFEVWDKAEATCLPDITINEEGISLYKDFSSRPKILVTLQGEKAVSFIIEKFSFSFFTIITREVSLSRVDQLKKAVAELKVPVQSILFVGDSENDAVAAKDVGCLFHKVTRKASGRKNL